MKKDREEHKEPEEKIVELNNILEELMDDATEFAKDLTASIYLYFVAGLLSILFGLQTGWYNRYYIEHGDIVPLLLSGAQMFVGILIVLRGFQLKNKYSRIFELKRELKNS